MYWLRTFIIECITGFIIDFITDFQCKKSVIKSVINSVIMLESCMDNSSFLSGDFRSFFSSANGSDINHLYMIQAPNVTTKRYATSH